MPERRPVGSRPARSRPSRGRREEGSRAGLRQAAGPFRVRPFSTFPSQAVFDLSESDLFCPFRVRTFAPFPSLTFSPFPSLTISSFPSQVIFSLSESGHFRPSRVWPFSTFPSQIFFTGMAPALPFAAPPACVGPPVLSDGYLFSAAAAPKYVRRLGRLGRSWERRLANC